MVSGAQSRPQPPIQITSTRIEHIRWGEPKTGRSAANRPGELRLWRLLGLQEADTGQEAAQAASSSVLWGRLLVALRHLVITLRCVRLWVPLFHRDCCISHASGSKLVKMACQHLRCACGWKTGLLLGSSTGCLSLRGC